MVATGGAWYIIDQIALSRLATTAINEDAQGVIITSHRMQRDVCSHALMATIGGTTIVR
jgi:hypothetical protein